jgi:N-acetylglutamate synthase-like GNAT family acetyltransferase
VTAIEVLENVPDDIRKFVKGKLREHAAEAGAPADPADFAIIERNEKGEIIAALIAERFWQCFYVDLLWVDKTKRGKGLGKHLMERAEKKARDQKCTSIYLWTASFYAPEFYEKLGYHLLATINNSPKGYKRQAYIKYLSEEKR